MSARVLAVRLDSDGDVLMTGPAIAALRRGPDGAPAERVDLLVAPGGAAAGRLLPGVDEVLVRDVPWSGYQPPAPDAAAMLELVELVRAGSYYEVVVFTSYHQSPLPMALLARLAGVPRVVAASDDYPGSLLDVRYKRPGRPDGTGGEHEVLANLRLVSATGRAVPADPRLAVRGPLPQPPADLADGQRYVVVHPGAAVPARAPSPEVATAAVAALMRDGWRVVVTGGPKEADLVAAVVAGAEELVGADAGSGSVVSAAGRTDFGQLAGLLQGAAAVVVGNTGPAHLSAAVGTPVASLFSAVMPLERWAPFGVPVVVLSDLSAPCRLSRAQICPVAGHPCLAVDPGVVVAAVADLAAGRVPVPPPAPAPAEDRPPGSDQGL